MLFTVLFALVLFLSGILTWLESLKIQVGLLVFAGSVYIVTICVVLTLPLSFAFYHTCNRYLYSPARLRGMEYTSNGNGLWGLGCIIN